MFGENGGTTKKVGILSLNAENGITYSEAFKKQLKFFTHHAAISLNIEVLVHKKVMPVPFLSATVQGCIENGKDITAGGTEY